MECAYVLVWAKAGQASALAKKIEQMEDENEQWCVVRADVVVGPYDIVVPVTATTKDQIGGFVGEISLLRGVTGVLALYIEEHNPEPDYACPKDRGPGPLGDNPWG
jgi:hypothetical protein